MSEKARIIDALGEQALRLPSLVNAALSANDRVKYLLTLLQTARQAAERPGMAPSRLKSERLAAGVRVGELDDVVSGASLIAPGRYRIPLCARILQDTVHCVGEMLAPLAAANLPQAAEFARRMDSLRPATNGDFLDLDSLRRLTSGDRSAGDSLHLLVMDLHKEINHLQAHLASESIAGCQVYGIKDADRPLVAAFMEGVAATAALKFEHPGLAATATRVREKLVIQNDLGTTDAHVLVMHVAGRTVSITYTDVHLARIDFFQSLFSDWKVSWEDTRSRRDAEMEDGVYHLCVGSYRARDSRDLRAYLKHVGSRLVFLIDWNRARKRLRLFVPKGEALRLLRWAARENVGHRGFLACGGENLVFDAMRFAFGTQLHPGARLDGLLGPERGSRYLQFVLQAASDGLSQGRPPSMIADEARAALAAEARSAEDALLDLVVEHAGLIQTLAAAVRSALDDAALQTGVLDRLAQRAKEWESAADAQLIAARDAAGGQSPFLLSLLSSADDIADELEDAAFNLSLPELASVDVLAALSQLAEPVALGAQELVKALLASSAVRHGASQPDVEDFLESVHRIQSLERKADLAQRTVKKTLLAQDGSFARLLPCLEAAQNLEDAADGLMRVALQLREHVLAEVGRG